MEGLIRNRNTLEVICSGVIIYLVLVATAPPSQAGSIASSDELIRKFEAAVFREDPELLEPQVFSTISRWENPVRIKVWSATSRELEFTSRFAVTLGRLSGLSIRAVSQFRRLDHNILLAFEPRSRFKEMLGLVGLSLKEQENLDQHAACYGWMKVGEGSISRAIVLVPGDFKDHIIRHCVVEELAQAMGIVGDADIALPSVFSNSPEYVTTLYPNDMVLLRTLYDPRLKSGMSKDEAMQIVRKIIPELVQAVNQRGVEALYQR